MSKVYKTNFSRGCFHHWTPSKAIAEYISNWLDSEGGQGYEFGDNYLILENKGVRVSNKLLMMGMSDKRGDDTKRGCFGVGSTQALVVLTDLNYEVSISNDDVLWTASFEHCENFDEEVLVVTETPQNQTGNFSVCISGLTQDIIEEVKQRCLEFQNREVLFSTEYGDVIENGEDQGEVYCGDMYVCENSGFKYSYNFKPKVLPLNQDRNAVDNWELKRLTAKIWKQCPDKELLKDAIESKTEDCSFVMDSWYTSDSQKLSVSEEYGEEYVAKWKGLVVTSDYSEYTSLTKCGNKVKYIDNSNKVKAIKESVAYKEMIDNMEIISVVPPRERLAEVLQVLREAIGDNNLEYDEYYGKTLLDWLDQGDDDLDEMESF